MPSRRAVAPRSLLGRGLDNRCEGHRLGERVHFLRLPAISPRVGSLNRTIRLRSPLAGQRGPDRGCPGRESSGPDESVQRGDLLVVQSHCHLGHDTNNTGAVDEVTTFAAPSRLIPSTPTPDHCCTCTELSATFGDEPFSLATTCDYDGLTITDSALFLGPHRWCNA